MKCEDIIADDVPDINNHTAQIHNNFLYVFSDIENKGCLWRFDISKRIALRERITYLMNR